MWENMEELWMLLLVFLFQGRVEIASGLRKLEGLVVRQFREGKGFSWVVCILFLK